MNNENKSYTQRVEDDFYEKINEGFVEDIEDSEDTIEYLNNIRNTITFGYALKRMICRKFSIGRNEADNKYICRTEDGREFLMDDYEMQDCSDEGYIELINYLRELRGIDRGKAQIKDIKRWLDNRHTDISREIVFRLGFILEMNSLEVNELLTKGIFENGYNFRDINETIYYFCHFNNLSYAKAEELLEKFNNSGEDAEVYEDNDITKKIKENILEITDEEEFIDYIILNKVKFTGHSATVKKVFDKLLEDAQELLEFYLKKKENSIKNPNSDEKVRKIKATLSTLSKELNPFNGKSIKESSIYDKVINGLLTKQKIGKIQRLEAKIRRKDLIYLNFFNYSCLCSCNEEIEKSKEFGARAEKLGNFIRSYDKLYDDDLQSAADMLKENMITFMDEMNDLLYSCDMGQMYYPNRFDNLILLSLCTSDPFGFWTGIIADSVEDEDEINNF